MSFIQRNACMGVFCTEHGYFLFTSAEWLVQYKITPFYVHFRFLTFLCSSYFCENAYGENCILESFNNKTV